MPSDATVHSYGTLLEVYTAAGVPPVGLVGAEANADWETIGCIQNITGPNLTVTATETSCLDSANARKTFIPGMVDSGEVTFTIDYTDDDEEYIDALLRSINYWRIKFPDGGRDVFQAFITSHSRNIPFDDRITMDVTLKITGSLDVTGYDVDPADRP